MEPRGGRAGAARVNLGMDSWNEAGELLDAALHAAATKVCPRCPETVNGAALAAGTAAPAAEILDGSVWSTSRSGQSGPAHLAEGPLVVLGIVLYDGR